MRSHDVLSRRFQKTSSIQKKASNKNSATLEYKLVALDGDGNPADWQLGENRIVEVNGAAGAGKKVSAVSVEENWEGGEAAVEVTVVEEEEEEEKSAPAASAVAPKATAAAPVSNAPAPSAFVQKPASASAASAAAVAAVRPAAAAVAPVPKPWASAEAPAAVPAAPGTASSSSSKALASLTVPQLKAKLKAAGLPTTGKKAELVARLEKGA